MQAVNISKSKLYITLSQEADVQKPAWASVEAKDQIVRFVEDVAMGDAALRTIKHLESMRCTYIDTHLEEVSDDINGIKDELLTVDALIRLISVAGTILNRKRI